MSKIFILYHGNCPDGTGAALAAYLTLGDEAEYIPVSYGKPPPNLPTGAKVYIVDFSYPRDVLLTILKSLSEMVVLDHHVTAQKDLEGVPGCHFDMNKSGAVLAWEYFHPNEPMPEFFAYLQDRDLWQFKLSHSREVSAAIGSYPFDFRLWSGWLADPHLISGLINEGRACLRLKNQQVDNMCKHWRRVRIDGKYRTVDFYPPPMEGEANEFGQVIPPDQWVCPVANATVFFSEVGERLLELHPDAPFSAYYLDQSDGKRQWGLRSRKDFDVSVIAKMMSGGGHAPAAGFVQEL